MGGTIDVLTRLLLDKGDFDKGLDDSEKGLFSLSKVGAVAGAAMLSLGAGLNHAEARMAEVRAVSAKLAVQNGGTAKSWEDLALSTSSAFFPLDDVLQVMDVLVKQGVRDRGEIKALSETFNALGEATGMTAREAAASGSTLLKAFGIPVQEAGKHVDTLTFMVRNSLTTLPEFESFMGRNGEKVRGLGLSLEQASLMMKVFSDRGISGIAANTAFNQALEKSAGDLGAFWQAIGVAPDELAAYQEAMKAAEGQTAALSAAHAETVTTTDKIRDALDRATIRAAQFLGPLTNLGPVLMTVAPALTIVSSVNFSKFVPSMLVAASATWAAIAALLPFILIAALVVAAIVGVILVIKNWGSVSDWLREKWEAFKEWFHPFWEVLTDGAVRLVKAMRDGIIGLWEALLAGAKHLWKAISDTIAGAVEFVFGLFRRLIEFQLDVADKLMKLGRDFISFIWDGIREGWKAVSEWFLGLGGRILDSIGDAGSTLYKVGADIVRGFWNGLKEGWEAVKSWFRNSLQGLNDTAKSIFGIASPAKKPRKDAEDIVAGYRLGLQGLRDLFRLDDLIDVGAMRPRERGSSFTQSFFGDQHFHFQGTTREELIAEFQAYLRSLRSTGGGMRPG